jgi:hypothetical protein
MGRVLDVVVRIVGFTVEGGHVEGVPRDIGALVPEIRV